MKKVLCVLMVLALAVFTFPVINAAKLDIEKSGWHRDDTITSKDGLWEYSKYESVPALYEYYGEEKNIVLPTEIDGQQISGVCYIENNNVESIYIPSNYTFFAASCFSNLKKLKKVEFAQDYSPFQVKRFDDALFQNCPKLEKVILPNDMECGSHYNQDLDEYISGGALPNDLFYNCKSLKEVTFPDNLTQIGCKAFEGCTSIERIVIPEGVLTIDVNAFKNTPSLKTLVLPDSIGKGGLNGAFNDVSPSTTVVCGENSVAAKKIADCKKSDPDLYQFSVVFSTPSDVKGDINRDKKFDINDVTWMQKYLVKDLDILCVNEPKLDFNNDGKQNILDCTLMQKALAGME